MAKGRGKVDVTAFGVKSLAREMRKLDFNRQKTLVRRVTKASAKRVKLFVAAGLANKYVKVRSGRYLAAWLSTDVRPLRRSSKVIGHGIDMPTRAMLGVRAKGNTYYPAYLEYGWKNPKTGKQVPAKAPIRKSVNEHQRRELAEMGRQLGREIEKEWRRIARKIAKAAKKAA